MAGKTQLEKELRFFAKNKKKFLKTYKNLFVVVKNDQFGGAFTSEAEAYSAGIEKYGNSPFLIKQAIDQEAEASFPALTVGLINVGL